MTRTSVDSGALDLVLRILERNAERHGQPSMREAADALRATAIRDGALDVKADGWFIALKDAKTGKVSELAIARTPESAADWRSRGYIVRPFVYLEKEDESKV